MKRILILLFALLLTVSSVVACTDGENSEESLNSLVSETFEDSSLNSDDANVESSVLESINSNEISENSSDIESSEVEDSETSDESSEVSDESVSEDICEDISEDISEDVSDEVSEDEIDTSEEEKPDEDNKEIISLFDSSNLENYASPFLPSYAPFSLYDTTLFSDSVITSISFPFDSLASGYSVDSDKLYMPIYVVKSDFSTSKEECTVENGKKIILDFAGKLSDVKRGDWLTVDNLEIKVSADETIAFGDTDMAVLPMFLRNDGTFGFWNKIFTTKGGNNHSLIFTIKGYKTSVKDNDDEDNGDKEGKYISFLGDSISTFSGWSNNTSHNNTIGNNKIWYPNNNYNGANLTVQDTWWYKVANELGYEIAVNNSWSGSVVNTSQTYNVRAKNLHNTSTNAKPDIVVIFMGVNDFAAGATVGAYDGKATPPVNPTNFSEAYGRMVQNIKDTYEGVEIYCCTFLPDRKRNSGSTNNNGIDDSEYNNAIRTIAKNMGVNLVDLFNDSGITPQNISQYTVDKLHPNKNGMSLVAQTIIDAIK